MSSASKSDIDDAVLRRGQNPEALAFREEGRGKIREKLPVISEAAGWSSNGPFARILNFIFGDARLGVIHTRVISFLAIVVALICGWSSFYAQDYFLWFFPWGERKASYMPNFIAGLVGIGLVTPLYLRRLIPHPFCSVNNILFLILNISMFSTVIQMVLGPVYEGPSIRTSITVSALCAAMFLSWLGIRAVAGLAWLLLVPCIALNAGALTQLGFNGYVFVTLGFCGLLLQTGLNPGELVRDIFQEYRKPLETVGDAVAGDVAATTEAVRKGAGLI